MNADSSRFGFYRPDIDGLRAIAILAVLCYHLGFTAVPGGFVGVDIFFVISGYLITRIIQDRCAQGRFSFREFYWRRALRILPALLPVLAFVILVGWRVLPPSDYLNTGKASVAAATYSSNFYFWRVGGYFDTELKLNPLLHTWSLAVEEQFYLVLPLLFVAAWRFGRRWVQGLVVLAIVVSLGATVVLVERFADEMFYWSPFRAWELASGSTLAVYRIPTIRQRAVREAAAVLSLGLMLIPCVIYGKTTVFPGPTAIPPVVGAALAIHVGASGRNALTHLLSMKAFVFIGLISYSLYLWHWPLVVFSKFALGWDGQGGWTALVLAPLAIACAWLSWAFVEKPFRVRNEPGRHWRIPVLATGSVVAAAVGGLMIASGGAPSRFSPLVRQLDSERIAHIPFIECDSRSASDDSSKSWCVIGASRSAADARVLIWGDSHALAWAPAFDDALRRVGETAIFVPASACPPMFGVKSRTEPSCVHQAQNVEAYLRDASGIELVVLSSSWLPFFDDASMYSLEDRFGSEGNSVVANRGLNETVSELVKQRHAVVVLGPVPGAPADVPLMRVVHEINGVPLLPAKRVAEFRYKNSGLFQSLSRVSGIDGATVIDVAPWFCKKSCEYIVDGQSVYRDGHHLSAFGAMAFSDRFKDIFVGALAAHARSDQGFGHLSTLASQDVIYREPQARLVGNVPDDDVDDREGR